MLSIEKTRVYRMIDEYEIMAIICWVLAAIVLSVLIFSVVYGQDAVDPRYYCIEKLNKPFPYNELCREQIMKEIMNYTDGLK